MFSSIVSSNRIAIPGYRILINNVSVFEMQEGLQSITVTEDLDAPSMVAIALNTYDEIEDRFSWVDNWRLKPGSPLSIKMGYDRLETVMVGEITGLEPEFSQEQGSTVTVRGHDLRHRLLRGTQTRTYLKLKDSQIAKQIAARNGLLAKVTDTKEKLEYVLQNNLSDLAFLQARSQRIGYEVWIDDRTLHFQPPQYRAKASTTLTFEEDLLEFSPRLSLLNQVTELEVRGWNWKQKQEIVGKSATNNIDLMDGVRIGVNASKSAFGTASGRIVDQPAQNQAEAAAMAQGQFEERALQYITGEGVCVGNPNVRAGSVIRIQGVGKRFSGLYYIVAVTHIFSISDAEYRTEFTVRRTSA